MLAGPLTGCYGVSRPEDVSALYGAASQENTKRQIACAIFVNSRSLSGQSNTEKYYPNLDQLEALFAHRHSAFNIAVLESSNRSMGLLEEIHTLLEIGGDGIHAIQFNFIPDPAIITIIRQIVGRTRLFLRIDEEYAQRFSSARELTTALFHSYGTDLDGVVLDPGRNANPLGILESCLRAFHAQTRHHYQIVIAELTSASLHKYTALLNSYPQTSIAAFRGLLSNGSFNLSLALEFMRSAEKLLGAGLIQPGAANQTAAVS